ncbi:MAG: DUF998 domain-containing protein [archaeon]|nr:DUF998 domain-containing protein [archaeon]MCP8314540.1 DUF998 domain-containing protein [archaeon]MCP8316956.1 DUF998 domain-containing protein [archaeon]
MSGSNTKTDTTQMLLAICGIIGPILYTIVVITLGFLRPGYNHVMQFMSELGEVGSQNAIIMNIAGFQLLGVLMIGFAFGLYRGTGRGIASKISAALVVVAGSGLVAVGFFPCDPGCVNVSFTGFMHSITATIPAVAMGFAPLVISLRMKNDILWEGYWLYSLSTSIVTIILSPLTFLTVFEPWAGALQRLSMAVGLLWIMVISIRLFRLSRISIV